MNFKELEISDELLCEILGCDVVKTEIKDNTLKYDCDFCDVVTFRNINIYELAFKCKEWAYTKSNYTLETSSNPFGGFCIIEIYQIDVEKLYNKPDSIYRGKNEVEAIIKACEWILEQSN